MKNIEDFKNEDLFGREARLLYEWEKIDEYCQRSKDVSYLVRKTTPLGLPVLYEVEYRIHSFCGVNPLDTHGLQTPMFADKFLMNIYIPNNYPNIDSKLEFKFALKDINGKEIPHPWHPNIRYFGDFAGRVCLTTNLYGSYTDLAWYIKRVKQYLKFEAYHADENRPPFPEDLEVAKWVREQSEPQGWIKELQEYHVKQKM